MLSVIKNFIKKMDMAIFSGDHESFILRLVILFCIMLLYVVGILHWAQFFNGGELSFAVRDWPKEYSYLSILKDSINAGVIPYHISHGFHGTNKFLGLPETILSPQIFLLSFMTIGEFLLFHVTLLYSIGFLGCYLIKKKYKLSLFSFAILFLLFNFNGLITSHLAVGHLMWGTYFLLPYFVLLVLGLLEGENRRSFSFKMAFVLFVFILQGGLHIYVCCLLFLLLLALFNKQYFKEVFFAILWGIFLSAFRLLPAMVALQQKKLDFISGYPTLRDLWDALTVIRIYSSEQIAGIYGGLYWWECDIFIGLIGLAILIYFGIILRFSAKESINIKYKYKALDYPLFALVIFSMNSFYAVINKLPIPFISVERLPSRFIIIPLVFLIVIAAIRMQTFFPIINQFKRVKIIAIICLMQMSFELFTHSRYWNANLVDMFTRKGTLSPPQIIAVPQDILYIKTVNFSLCLSLIMLFVWFYLFLKFSLEEK